MLHRTYRLSGIALAIGLLTFAACSSTTSSTGVGSSTPSAQEIIAKSKAAPLKDATYSITLNVAATGSATPSPLGAIAGTGTGKLTTNPKRTDTTFTINLAGTNVSAEVITDGSDTYTKLQGEPKWRKDATGAAPVDASSILNYDQYQNATVVGGETVNGVLTWHLRTDTQNLTGNAAATATAVATQTSSAISGTQDLWVRQDNGYPVKVQIQATGSSASSGTPQSGDTGVVVTFTKWDSGVTITVPTPDQITSGS